MCVFIRYNITCRIGLLFSFLLMQLIALTQQKSTFSSDSLFKKMADTTIRAESDPAPYYIIAWEKTIPGNIKIIRQLDERMAIIDRQ